MQPPAKCNLYSSSLPLAAVMLGLEALKPGVGEAGWQQAHTERKRERGTVPDLGSSTFCHVQV